MKKMTAMMNTIPATMATQAAAAKTRGGRWWTTGAGSTAAGAGANAVQHSIWQLRFGWAVWMFVGFIYGSFLLAPALAFAIIASMIWA